MTDEGMVRQTRLPDSLRASRRSLEGDLRRLGITHKNRDARGPQDRGLAERFQHALTRWLAARSPQSASRTQFRTLPDTFTARYNHKHTDRRHQRHVAPRQPQTKRFEQHAPVLGAQKDLSARSGRLRRPREAPPSMTGSMRTHLRPLPRTVAPFPGETIASYLRRLAVANCSDERVLRVYITGDAREIFPFAADRLAVAAGRDVRALRLAIPDLSAGQKRGRGNPNTYSHRKDDGLACRLCTAAKGITEPVRCWKQPENVICLHHQRWIGIGSTAESDQPDLAEHPDILRAHRRHLRLVRRLGRDAVAMGYAVADEICRKWAGRRFCNDGFRRRMQIFDASNLEVHHIAPTIAAAMYPEVVGLTRLLASPYWQAQAQPGNADGQQRFAAEVSRTVAPGYQWPQPPRSGDPLYHWIIDRRPHEPPLSNYRRWPVPPQLVT